jgi:tetratricopeptide (TPR) repeat protein
VPVVLGLLAALVGLGGALLVVGLLIAWFARPQPARRIAQKEDAEERRHDVKAAFQGRGPVAEGELARELDVFFKELGAAFRARDQERLVAHYDAERMFDQLADVDLLPPAERRNRRRSVESMRGALGRALLQRADVFQWQGVEVRNVKHLPGNDIVVIVRHHAPEGITLKMRWWLAHGPDGWKVYDMEDLDMGMRFSTICALVVGVGAGNIPDTVRGGKGVTDALVALVRNDTDTAERKLKSVENVKLPKQMEAMRHVARGSLHLQRGQFQEALAAYDRAHASHADMPCLNLLRGIAFNGLGQWDKALKHIEAYRGLLGEDPLVCWQLGEALRGKERFPEAAVAYRKSLDQNPKEGGAFIGLLHSLTAQDKRDDLPARFAKLDKHEEVFAIAAEDCREGQDSAGLEQISLAMQKIDPRYAPADYYLSLVRAWAGRADQAVPLFRSALVKEKDLARHKDYLMHFLRAMVKGNRGAESYAVAPPPHQDEAFRFLAGELHQTRRADELKKLVAAHARNKPADPLLPFYRAEVYVWEENYPLAERSFAAGLARPPDAVTLERFRSGRVLARYHSGQALAAYREIGPRDETFAQLALLLFLDENHAQLQQLLDAHGKTAPDHPDVLRYRFRLKIKQGQTAEAVTLFQSALAKQKQEEQRKRLLSEFLDDMRGAGKVVEAYRAAANARAAFAELADDLLDEQKVDEVRRLLDAHRRRHADDPALHLYTGRLHLVEKAWDKAAESLEQVWKKGTDELRKQARWN